MTLLAAAFRACCLALALTSASLAQEDGWAGRLQQQVERIDQAAPGRLGLYVKRLDTGETLSYQADRPWYLASSAKLPIAIAVLQEVEAGRRRLGDTLRLQETDKVDGSGPLVWQGAGTGHTLQSLLRGMLMASDNTAANMLVRSIGEERLNERAKAMLGRGFERLTTFTQVRYDVYAELHPDARRLRNPQLVEIAAAPLGPQRVEALRRALGKDKSALQVPTLDEAYRRYYERGLNAATLQGYGGMLEQLVRGKLLSPAHTERLFADLKIGSYDAYRLEAGLPRSVRFIHKTGTQFRRACHMGVIEPQDGGRAAIVVAACAEDLDEHKDAARLFEQVGRAITATMLPGRQPRR